jgi:hypothetical protein
VGQWTIGEIDKTTVDNGGNTGSLLWRIGEIAFTEILDKQQQEEF